MSSSWLQRSLDLAVQDGARSPAGKTLKRKQLSRKDKMIVYAADAQDCAACQHKGRCTQAAPRFVTRHLYESALRDNAARLVRWPDAMAIRRQTMEHPFDSIKHRILGNARLLMRAIAGAQAELSLAVLVYNLKRVFNMKGAAWMHQAVRG